ncbi:MAG TPA: acyl-CoA reductase [Candidatus Binataceae bacterium]|nr:acyl-CoA reductase [Candidatus Binataceae bacterium]
MNSIASPSGTCRRQRPPSPSDGASPEPSGRGSEAAAAIDAAAERLRGVVRCAPSRVAAALAANAELWRARAFASRRETVATIAATSGMAPALLDESLDALLAPLSRAALETRAAEVPSTSRLYGFVMAGNVAGAGIHELCAALLAGARVIVKPASAEPVFFANFIGTLRDIDARVGALAEPVQFGRSDTAAMRALWARCDGGIVAYGDDASIAALGAAREDRAYLGFPSRLSGALVMADVVAAPAAADAVAAALARDVTLFEQRGCLSPHHVFVAGRAGAGAARGLAARLARALEVLARRLPPARLPLEAAAAIRAQRERVRWRALALRGAAPASPTPDDEAVALWEGDGLGWTAIYDRDAGFCPSPGYRTVVVSWLEDLAELGSRLGAVAGRLEAFALVAPPNQRKELASTLRALGVWYVCEPGQMQSPPLDWPHGGDAFIEMLRDAAR